jgi:hypothetical protein
VNELRERIARGEYRVDAEMVASSIVNKALVVRRIRHWLDEAGQIQPWAGLNH